MKERQKRDGGREDERKVVLPAEPGRANVQLVALREQFRGPY